MKSADFLASADFALSRSFLVKLENGIELAKMNQFLLFNV